MPSMKRRGIIKMNEKMKERIEEIKNQPDMSKIAEEELKQTIEEGDKMSEENRELFRGILG